MTWADYNRVTRVRLFCRPQNIIRLHSLLSLFCPPLVGLMYSGWPFIWTLFILFFWVVQDTKSLYNLWHFQWQSGTIFSLFNSTCSFTTVSGSQLQLVLYKSGENSYIHGKRIENLDRWVLSFLKFLLDKSCGIRTTCLYVPDLVLDKPLKKYIYHMQPSPVDDLR
jgi:hypothetical protein